MRVLNPLDRLISAADHGLRVVSGNTAPARRPSPGAELEQPPLSVRDARRVARLLRVDHAGEVAAQALYEGQALVARDAQLAESLRHAALEEADHLAWCAERLDELDARPSVLGPLWYGGSLLIGAAAGLAGDRWSLGFLVETERQVERHLADHLRRLPAEDRRSRAVLERMQADEVQHAVNAEAAGGRRLPAPLRALMRVASRVMTGSARWL